MSLVFESGYYAFGFYAALNALVMLVLGVLVTRARVTYRVDIGDGGVPQVAGPLRAHANNTEYVPMALLLVWALASPLGGSIWLIHGVGGTLTLGRILHALGLSQSTGPSTLRLVGIMLTWISFIVGIVGVFYLILFPQA
ncbi:MAG TPA: MAPEG family protein [Rhizomicrobium sp.]|nr:MAPEG family protein [Rhizomicrobium sp.]